MRDLNKVLSGDIILKTGCGLLVVKQPSAELRYLADFFSQEVYDEAFESNIFLQEELEELIIENGWWEQEQEDLLKSIPKDLEQMKVDYFNNFIKSDVIKSIKKAIKKREDQFEKLTQTKYGFFNYTCESLKSQAYTMYILENSTFDMKNNPVDISKVSLYSLYSKYNKELLLDDEIREISKSSEWRMIWNSTKDGYQLFSFPAINMTDMQKSLVNWTRVYDSVYESMEVPSDEIINDNYAIDGWFTVQRRKRDDDKKESSQQNLPNNAEVFVPISNDEDANKVHEMNTGHGKAILKSKFKELKQKGAMEESEFSHVKQDLQMRANKAMFDRSKR